MSIPLLLNNQRWAALTNLVFALAVMGVKGIGALRRPISSTHVPP